MKLFKKKPEPVIFMDFEPYPKYKSPTDEKIDCMASEYKSAMRSRVRKKDQIRYMRRDELETQLVHGTISPDEYTVKLEQIDDGIDEIVAALYPINDTPPE